jgi:hypothetical protein
LAYKNLMKRFFRPWGFLKFVLGAITLIIFFYVEEDWRGARAWAVTRAKWEAKGESFDYAKFIPPPIPDDQNLAALPLFKLEPAKDYLGGSDLELVALQQAMRSDFPNMDFPSTGNWQKGELPDMAKIRNVVAANYTEVFKGAKPPEDTVNQFNAVYPFLTDFLAAGVTHPFFRLNQDYTISPPVARPLGPMTQQIKLSKLLTLHAVLALDQHRSDLALEDIKTNYKILSGIKRDPTLIGGLVAIGMAAINDAALYDGLAQHAWSAAQLVELDQLLKPINFLADYQFALRSEIAQSIANYDAFEKHARRVSLRGLFLTAAGSNLPLLTRFAPPWPDGWWDSNKSQLADALLESVSSVDPQLHRVYPDRSEQLQEHNRRFADSWDGLAPWNILFVTAVGPITNGVLQYAQAQTWIDEARIACALERYHLAHGNYPPSLDDLAPACIDELPHDVITGEAYHYRLQPDGTFLLYSVGWNQKDDGGVAVFSLTNSTDPNDSPKKHGDWVWPTPQLNPQK